MSEMNNPMTKLNDDIDKLLLDFLNIYMLILQEKANTKYTTNATQLAVIDHIKKYWTNNMGYIEMNKIVANIYYNPTVTPFYEQLSKNLTYVVLLNHLILQESIDREITVYRGIKQPGVNKNCDGFSGSLDDGKTADFLIPFGSDPCKNSNLPKEINNYNDYITCCNYKPIDTNATEIIFNSITSTSLSPKIFDRELYHGKNNDCCKIIITLPIGTPCYYIIGNSFVTPSEYEVLLPLNSKFRKKSYDDSTGILELEMLPYVNDHNNPNLIKKLQDLHIVHTLDEHTYKECVEYIKYCNTPTV